MHITKVAIKNYRCLEDSTVDLNAELNLLVGNNECGKSTLLEAINLALSGQLNGRPVQQELHPHLFNATAVAKYLKGLAGTPRPEPPSIQIELYLADDNKLAKLKGSNNSAKLNVPGIKLIIEYNEEYKTEYAEYVAKPDEVRTVPVEYYVVRWRSFADNDITSRSIPIEPTLIDASTIRNTNAASRYVLDAVKASLNTKQRAALALTYRRMKDTFMGEPSVVAINDKLKMKAGKVSSKTLSVALDATTRSGWEAGIMPQLDDIPMTMVGKGEQNSVKIKLAMDTAEESHVLLIEEPENHLTYSNLNILIGDIAADRGSRQLIIATHSSFVLNKLGLDSVLLFANATATSLSKLSPDTKNYFLKLPGHDTLRLILCRRAILVEGPSDELIVQKAFHMKHGKLPLEAGVDVITVNSLAFKRFLDIALLLKLPVDVVTDNDGDLDAIKKKYADYADKPGMNIRYSPDTAERTLEPQLVKANGLEKVNAILGTSHPDLAALHKHMKDNKTECALKFFEAKADWVVPDYIGQAIG